MSREVPSGWSLATLESFVEEFKVLDSVGNLPPLSVTKSNGIVFQSEKFNKRIANASSSNYKVVRSGEYSYDPMSLYYGAIGRLNVCDAGIVSPAYVTFRLKGAIERDFFDLYVKTSDFLVEVNKVTEGGNQDGKRKKTDWKSFCSLPISVPPTPRTAPYRRNSVQRRCGHCGNAGGDRADQKRQAGCAGTPAHQRYRPHTLQRDGDWGDPREMGGFSGIERRGID